MKTRGVALILTFTMILTIIPTTIFGAGFIDMPNNWSTFAVEMAVENGLLKGDNGKIRPEDNLSRAEMASIVNRAFNASGKAPLSKFSDVLQGQWYYEDMAKAVQMGTFVGFKDKLNPEKDITREEAFVVVARAFKISGEENTALNSFSDKEMISSWAKNEVGAMVKAGYIKGSNGQIKAKENITRAEFAQLMDNLIKTYITKTGQYESDLMGNVMVNKEGVNLKGITIRGDLIIGDGLGDGEIILEDIKVTGRLLVRGGGQDSIKIMGNSDIKRIIIARLGGKTKVYTGKGIVIDEVIVDGNKDVTLEGKYKSVIIKASDVTVYALDANIESPRVIGERSKFILAEETQDLKEKTPEAKANPRPEPTVPTPTPTPEPIPEPKVDKVIDIPAIAGVTVPVAGQVPVSTITGTDQYSGIVTWSPEDAVFGDGVTYTATINLRPKLGYTLRGVGANFFTVSGSYATNGANTGLVKAVFPETEIEEDMAPYFNFSEVNEEIVILGLTTQGAINFGTDLLIPSKINGKPVTFINSNAFFAYGLTSVVLPESLIGIAERAFSSNKLKELTLPDSVEFIAMWAFEDNELSRIKIGKSLTYIDGTSFDSGSILNYPCQVYEGVWELRGDHPIWTKLPKNESDVLITISAIEGVTIPVAGAIPVETIIETDQYTGSVIWNPSDANFEEGTTYFATIFIRPKENYTLSGLPANFFSVAGADTSNGRNSCQVLAIFPATQAEIGMTSEDATAAGFIWQEDTITGYNGSNKNVLIPKKIGGTTMTKIGGEAFYNKELTSVSIPNSVTSIGLGAFSMNKLNSLSIPESVTTIGVAAFQYNKLTTLVIPDSVTTMGSNAFAYNSLDSVLLSNSLTELNNEVFMGNMISSITIPNTITIIGDTALYNNKLTSISIPDSVTKIGSQAFGYNELTSVTIPKLVTIIEWKAFTNNKLTSVLLPESVTTIKQFAFSINKLNTITIPSLVTTIEVGAFSRNGPNDNSESITTGAYPGVWTLNESNPQIWLKQ